MLPRRSNFRARRMFRPGATRDSARLESRLLLASQPVLEFLQAVDPARAAAIIARKERSTSPTPAAAAQDGPRVWNLTIRPRQATILVTYQVGTTPLDTATASNPANYRLSLPLRSPTQNLDVTSVNVATPSADGTQTVFLQIGNGRRLLHGAYQFTIVSGGVTDTLGRPLDGEYLTNKQLPSGNGTPGGNFTAILATNSIVAFHPESPRQFKFFGFAPFPRH